MATDSLLSFRSAAPSVLTCAADAEVLAAGSSLSKGGFSVISTISFSSPDLTGSGGFGISSAAELKGKQ